MKDSIHKYFKIGTILWMSYPNSDVLESLYKIACDDYFDAVEIGLIPDPVIKEKAIKILRQSHLKVCYGAQPRLLGPKLNPNAIEERERQLAEATLIAGVDEAESLGAKSMAFLAGKWEAETKQQAYEQLLKTTRAVCDHAMKKGMSIELEVFDYDMDKSALIGPAPYAAKFAADMRTTHSNFGLLVDLSHIPTTYETSKFVIQTLRPYISHFHIGNAVVNKHIEAYGDQHPRFGFPGGVNDVAQLAEFFSVLKEEGFFNAKTPYVLSFEVKPWGDEDAQIILANTKRVVNRAWALVDDDRGR